MELKKRPVIIDCDPGTDDAVAMLMMLGSGMFDILGVCPVNGNKPLELTEVNALKILETAGRKDIPVLRGASKGILIPQRTADDIHGSNGLGGIELPGPEGKVRPQYAWDFMYEQALRYDGELEILAIGPLTNLGIALLKYPDLPGHVKKLTVMGGAFSGGNQTAAAEFNIWVDPHAAKLVFGSGMNIAMMGLDICETAYVTAEDVRGLRRDSPATVFAGQLLDRGLAFSAQYGAEGSVMCDAAAAFHMICPDGTEVETVHIDVETNGILTEGATTATRPFTEHVKFIPNAEAGVKVDRELFARTLIGCLNGLN